MQTTAPIKHRETVNINLEQIKPYWRNPRDNEPAVEAVAESIRNYGNNVPIVVDKKLVIIAGHTRFKALTKLGVSGEIPCILADLPAKKAKEFRIADNKTSELATWNNENLIQELREIELTNLEIFFPETDLDNLIQNSIGAIKWNEVTAESFAQSELAEANKIGVLTDKRTKDVQSVTCPNCGEDFQVI